jgi:hypothetical protein
MIGKLLHFMLKTEESMAWLNKAYRVISGTLKSDRIVKFAYCHVILTGDDCSDAQKLSFAGVASNETSRRTSGA